jgi:pyruvate formate lyase activating enzyme
VIDKFKRNQKFYQHGGITLSGGEPLIHQQFCLALAKLCKTDKISLALDTSGATFNQINLKFYKALIKYHPLWIVDIKHINPKKHKLITGVSTQNELSLIKFLEKNKQPYWIRQVLVPQYTDDPGDLKSIGKLIKQLKYLQNFELLPYHRLAIHKYESLNISNKMSSIKEPTKQMIDQAKHLINTNIK